MNDFYTDLSALLKKHKVAIISKPNGYDDSVIGFQSSYCDNYWTTRHHVTGYDVECKIDEVKESAVTMEIDQSVANEMYKFLDDLANGRGTDYPIEKLLAKMRKE